MPNFTLFFVLSVLRNVMLISLFRDEKVSFCFSFRKRIDSKFQVNSKFFAYVILRTNNTHAKISASSLAESTSINPKQCRKLKLSAKR